MKQKYFYKLTTADLTSAVIDDSDWGVNYKIGKWVCPKIKNSKLLVFKDLKSVKSFCPYGLLLPGSRIFKCGVKNPAKINYIVNSDWPGLFKDFWNKKLKDARIIKSTPRGTYGVDAVKLIEEVEK